MSNIFIRNIARFLILIFVQVLILNNINISGYLNPYIYILFILLLPAHINRSLLLLLAFFTGITIDFFGNTMGLNAAATVFMGFLRTVYISVFFSNIDFDSDEEPGIRRIGVRKFLGYTFILVLVHHLSLFLLEAFTFRDIHLTLYRIFLSTLLSTFLIMIVVLLTSKKKS